ncbi:MAG: transketolase family protein [Fervidicoccaceae archaeon]
MTVQLTAKSYRKALGETLVELGLRNSDVVVLDADTARSTGTFAFAEMFPHRFFNIGISEQDLISTAAGMAIAGLLPVAVAFASFMMRGWEQIRNTVARDRLNVKLVGTHAGLSAHIDGSSHQALEDLALTRVLPGFTVVSPADAIATRELLRCALEEVVGPVYVRLGRDNALEVYERGDSLRLGRASVLRDGEDVLVVACGPMVRIALEASKLAEKVGLRAMVVDLHTIKPPDSRALVEHARRTGCVLTLEEHSVVGGLGSTVAEVLSEEYPVPLRRIGIRESFGTSARSYEELLAHYGLTPEKVLDEIIKLIKQKR